MPDIEARIKNHLKHPRSESLAGVFFCLINIFFKIKIFTLGSNFAIINKDKMKELTKIQTIILLLIFLVIGGLVLYGENKSNNFNPLDYVFKR